MFAIGVDFGANSTPAVVVRCADGVEFGSSVVGYSSGDEGALLDESDHHLARQQPTDYLYSLELGVKPALAAAVYDNLRALCRQLYDGIGVRRKSIDLSRFMTAPIEIKYARQE